MAAPSCFACSWLLVEDGPEFAALVAGGVLVPAKADYSVTSRLLNGELPPAQVIPATVLVDGEAQSVIARAARAVAAVLIRESGF